MLTPFIQQLMRRQNLTAEQCEQALEYILGGAEPLQIAAFLVLLHAKPITAAELYGLVKAMRSRMIPVRINAPLLDIVGTGGDGVKTVNISTAASILAASCGAKVAKHGNRSVSSACGSADVLAAFDIYIEMNAQQIADCINAIGIGFCFAPLFHPAMAVLKPIRNALKVPTTFNLMGPLLNPAQAQYYLLGVANPNDMPLLADVLCQLGVEHALVVHSAGLDELSLLGPSQVTEIKENKMHSYVIDPLEYGFVCSHLADIQGDTPAINVARLQAVFAGEHSPLADTVIFNTGAALFAADIVTSIAEGIDLARNKLYSSAAQQLLVAWQHFSQRLQSSNC